MDNPCFAVIGAKLFRVEYVDMTLWDSIKHLFINKVWIRKRLKFIDVPNDYENYDIIFNKTISDLRYEVILNG